MKTSTSRLKKAPTFTRQQLALLNASEKKLVQDSLGKSKTAKPATVASLKKSVVRTRALLTKHRDLLKRQAARSKTKTARKSVTDKNHLDNNQRTRAKIAIFQTTLGNFQAHLKTASAKPVPSKTLGKKTKKTTKTLSKKKALAPKKTASSKRKKPINAFEATMTPVQAQRIAPKAMLGHVSSQGRRNQARRDSKNG
jgi:hypothetical protein